MKGFKVWIKDFLQDVWDDAKRAHVSTTQRFNAGVAFLAILLPYLLEFLPQMKPYMPVVTYETWMQVLILGNGILRFKTKTRMANK